MSRGAAFLVVVVAVPGPAVAQGAVAPPAGSAAAQAPADPADLERITRRLETPTPLRDAVVEAPPTFRVSVSQEGVDIRRFWGEPDAVAGSVHPSGGPWHHEFVNMVTPDAFKGYGAIFTNNEKAALASQQMMTALAWQYLPVAIAKTKKALTERAAKADVQRELAAFYTLHPEARRRTQP
jgi:hypothetical protein